MTFNIHKAVAVMLNAGIPMNIVRRIVNQGSSEINKYNALLANFKKTDPQDRGKLIRIQNRLINMTGRIPPGTVPRVPPLPSLKRSATNVRRSTAGSSVRNLLAKRRLSMHP
jgi:hypothetical protein